MTDAYVWMVRYRDGSVIAQINDEGVDVGSWRKVDVHHVELIRLDPCVPGLPTHGVLVPEGAIAFLTFRRTHELNPNTGEQFTHPAITIAGWERDAERSYLYVDSFGNAVLTSERDYIV